MLSTHCLYPLKLKLIHLNLSFKTGEKYLSREEIISILEQQDHDTALCQLQHLLQEYQNFYNQTLNGEHGKTAKYVMTYIYYIDLYLLFESGIRDSDVDLYAYSSYQICTIFFTYNHQNYARWLTLYQDKLANIDQTHPEMRHHLENGSLSVRRTSKNFARTHVDLCLEQTINADAVNRLTSITAFTNSIYARAKWAETHAIRASITSFFLDSIGKTKSDDVISSYQSKKFGENVKNLLEITRSSINPFDEIVNENGLVNLISGKPTSEEAASFLTNIRETGLKQLQKFKLECNVDPNRIDKPIKRNVIRSFDSLSDRNATVVTDADLSKIMDQILLLITDKNISVTEIFEHPITFIPYSLVHYDGTFYSYGKSDNVLTLFKTDSEIDRPNNITIEIIDGFSFFETLTNCPTKYGELAESILKELCNTTSIEIHLIFDDPLSHSIRDATDTINDISCVSLPRNYKIDHCDKERPFKFSKLIKNPYFKTEFANFLLKHWSQCNDLIKNTINAKRVFVSFQQKCYLFSNDNEMGRILPVFDNNHFESASRIIFHLRRTKNNHVLIKTNDVNYVLVSVLYHMQFMHKDKKVYIQSLQSSRASRKIVDVRKIYESLDLSLVLALPGWYVFTGCQYEPAFYNKPRRTSFKILTKYQDYQNAFAELGQHAIVPDEIFTSIENFTCILYNNSGTSNINQLRADIFERKYKARKGKIIVSFFIKYL